MCATDYRPDSPSLPARAFTLLEMVVTMAALGLLMAFALPQLTGVSTMNAEQEAKISINAAMDVLVADYGRTFPSQGWSDGNPAQPRIDADTLRVEAPDVRFTGSPTAPVTASNQVGVGVKLMKDTTTGAPWWRVGVASLAPGSSGGSCWMAWRDLDPPGGRQLESYQVVDLSDPTQVSLCTGKVAANWAPLAALPSGAPIKAGYSWQVPWPATLPELQQAHSLG